MNKRILEKVCIVVIGTLIFGSIAYGLNLSRVKTWSAEILTHTDLNAEFDNILSHEITNTDISASAAIARSKVSGIGTTDSPTFAGLTLTGALAANGDSITSDGVLTINATSTTSFNDESITNVGDIKVDTISADDATSFAMGNNWTNAGKTIADLGIVTTTGTFGLGGKLTAGATEIEGSNFDINGGVITGITDLIVEDGGTGAGTFTDGGVLLGSGTSAFTAMSVLADGAIIVGDNSTDPVALAVFSSSTGDVTMTAGGTGASLTNDPGGILYCAGSVVAVLADGASGKYLKSGGTGAPSWDSPSAAQSEVFTSSGTFTVPAGVTTVFVSMVGAGGGGEDRDASEGAGGGGGEGLINYPHTVTPAAGLTVTIGAGGAAGSSGDGGDGGDTVFDTITVSGGLGGGNPSNGQGGTGGGNAAIAGDGATGGNPSLGGTGQSIKGGDGGAARGAGGGSIFGIGGNSGISASTLGQPGGYGAGGGGNAANSATDGVGGAGIVYVQW